MQSIRRMILRGNAVMLLNNVTKAPELIIRKEVSKKVWAFAVRNRLVEAELRYVGSITVPLTKDDLYNAPKKGHIFKYPNR